MAGPIEVQLRNARSAMLFMQQEHAQTLQGLHGELQKLQKKCAELTFELAMKSDDVDRDLYKELQEKLESKREETERDIEELHQQLEERDRKVFSLEQQLKLQAKKLQSEAKQTKQKLASLNNELDQKSANIAYLTSQLHQMALVKHKEAGERSDEDGIRSGAPQPPKRPPPSNRRRVRTPSMETVSVLKSGTTAVAGAALSESRSVNLPSRRGRHLSSPTRYWSFDDREVSAYFAKVRTSASDVEIKPAPPILPPISPLPQERGGSYSPEHSPYYSRGALRVSKRRESEAAGINSLAVQTVHGRSDDLHAARQPNGDGSQP